MESPPVPDLLEGCIDPLQTGSTTAIALLGKDLFEKALAKNQPLETKPRVLETVKIL